MTTDHCTIAVDALGGDHAPGVVVDGAVLAARAGCRVVLVGPTDLLRVEIARAGATGLETLSIEDAPDGVAMDEAPLAALRRKPRASIRVACELVAAGRAVGVYSAGHTGASLIAAHATFGMIAGVERPALAVIVPTRTGGSGLGQAVLLDAGANSDSRASHLAQFGVMGAVYATVALGIADPGVALLSTGEEASKGKELVKEAHAALAAMPIRFLGNIDAAQWFHGIADVVVADGFVGNIALKVGEAVVEMMAQGASAEALGSLHYATDGGAPLIGVAGLLVVGHGRSAADAISHGIQFTAKLADGQVVAKVAEAIQRVLK